MILEFWTDLRRRIWTTSSNRELESPWRSEQLPIREYPEIRTGRMRILCWTDSSLGFPPEFRVTVYVRKWSRNFFHFHYGKGSGKPPFFFRKTEISGTLFQNYGLLQNSGTFGKFPEDSGISFRKFPENRSGNFRKIVPEISGFQNIWYQNYIKVLHM